MCEATSRFLTEMPGRDEGGHESMDKERVGYHELMKSSDTSGDVRFQCGTPRVDDRRR